MPKKEIDYSKTIIYKIVCNDLSVKDLYVGHTTSFKHRKSGHKTACNNPNDKSYEFKLYQCIRENHGWNNWSMIEIEKYPCSNYNEARKQERYWYELLNANLNTVNPSRSKKQYNVDHSDEINLTSKAYYRANKKTINERRNTAFICECGGNCTIRNKSTHYKSIKHQKYVQIEKFKVGIIKCQSLEELKLFMQQ